MAEKVAPPADLSTTPCPDCGGSGIMAIRSDGGSALLDADQADGRFVVVVDCGAYRLAYHDCPTCAGWGWCKVPIYY